MSLTVGGVVAALVLKAAEKTGEQLAGSGLAAVGRLVDLVRRRFQERRDGAAAAALARVQDPPASEQHLAALAAAVDRHADQDGAFAEELLRLVREGQAAGVHVQQISQTAWGSDNVQLGNVTGSTVNINTGRPPAGGTPPAR